GVFELVRVFDLEARRVAAERLKQLLPFRRYEEIGKQQRRIWMRRFLGQANALRTGDDGFDRNPVDRSAPALESLRVVIVYRQTDRYLTGRDDFRQQHVALAHIRS